MDIRKSAAHPTATQHPTSASPSNTPDLVELTPEQYAAQFKQMDKEALYTFLAAVLITLVFWGAIFLTHDLQLNVFYMPLWFVLSCIGGYVFSVVVVVLLVKKFMRNLELKVQRSTATKPATPEQQTE